jgi:hypothetical protein
MKFMPGVCKISGWDFKGRIACILWKPFKLGGSRYKEISDRGRLPDHSCFQKRYFKASVIEPKYCFFCKKMQNSPYLLFSGF